MSNKQTDQEKLAEKFYALPQIVIGRRIRISNAVIELNSMKVVDPYDPDSDWIFVGKDVTEKFFDGK